jgi:hypothetical protein
MTAPNLFQGRSDRVVRPRETVVLVTKWAKVVDPARRRSEEKPEEVCALG